MRWDNPVVNELRQSFCFSPGKVGIGTSSSSPPCDKWRLPIGHPLCSPKKDPKLSDVRLSVPYSTNFCLFSLFRNRTATDWQTRVDTPSHHFHALFWHFSNFRPPQKEQFWAQKWVWDGTEKRPNLSLLNARSPFSIYSMHIGGRRLSGSSSALPKKGLDPKYPPIILLLLHYAASADFPQYLLCVCK